MMRKFFVFVFLFTATITVSQSAQAQKTKTLRFGIGINAGSTIKDPTRFVLGADGRLQLPFGNSISGILTTGYYHFFRNNKAGEGFGIIPLKAGLKYFPAKNVYIAGEAGAGFITNGSNNISFVYSPSVGVAFGNGLDVSLKFEDYTKYEGYASQFALRLAYGFKL